MSAARSAINIDSRVSLLAPLAWRRDQALQLVIAVRNNFDHVEVPTRDDSQWLIQRFESVGSGVFALG
jgi:hypothetical protein